MEKIDSSQWKDFSERIMSRWPNITTEELMQTEGYFEMVEQLLESKELDSVDKIKRELHRIFDQTKLTH